MARGRRVRLMREPARSASDAEPCRGRAEKRWERRQLLAEGWRVMLRWLEQDGEAEEATRRRSEQRREQGEPGLPHPQAEGT
jgi:hypothetical protein